MKEKFVFLIFSFFFFALRLCEFSLSFSRFTFSLPLIFLLTHTFKQRAGKFKKRFFMKSQSQVENVWFDLIFWWVWWKIFVCVIVDAAIITISGVIFIRSIFSISTSISISRRFPLFTQLSHNFLSFFCVFVRLFFFSFSKENCRDFLRPRSRANHAISSPLDVGLDKQNCFLANFPTTREFKTENDEFSLNEMGNL